MALWRPLNLGSGWSSSVTDEINLPDLDKYSERAEGKGTQWEREKERRRERG